jgi:hexosaminidase
MLKKFIYSIIAAIVPFTAVAQSSELDIIPKPQEVKVNEGYFLLDENVAVKGNDPFSVNYLKEKIKNSTSITLLDEKANAQKVIGILIDPNMEVKKEGYTLTVTPQEITIKAIDKAGAFYGVQTLLQLFPATIYGKATGWEDYKIPAVEIKDYPRFGYRGVMLDVSRTFSPLPVIYNLLDWLSYHKINTFHWHLTDDNGWRIEIKKYPYLTQKGAWRGPGEVLPPTYGSGHKRYGGFYTQAEIKEVIKYAADRNIEIIPEIDMPGHSKSVIGAYPSVGCDNKTEFVSVNGEVKNVWCVGNEENYKMLDGIIKELAALFPSDYIHIGGDEVNMNNWKECSRCKALMEEKQMKHPSELQNYFVRRLEKIVNKYGKKMAGWDEILDGGELMKDTRVYAWRTVKRGIESVKKGQSTVMQVGEYCYVDMKQSPLERGHNWAGIVTLEKIYSLDPTGSFNLTPDEEKLVLGPQAGLWTELLNRPARFLEYQYFPRVAALAEVGWTKGELKNFDDFKKRLENSHYERMFNMGIAFRVPYPNVIYENNTLKVTLPYKHAVVRYTTDGSEPTCTSNIYTGDIVTFEPLKFKFATFYKDIIKSITVGPLNIEPEYLKPEVEVTSTFDPKDYSKGYNMDHVTNYNFKKCLRVSRAAVKGDWVLYNFKEPVKCNSIKVETGMPNITFYSVTDGYVEYSYNGKDFIKGDEFVHGIANIYPQQPVKAVRIVVTNTSDALAICFQALKIE